MPMVTVQQAFALAHQHHQAGRLAEAEALYRQVLAVQPKHADALHFLGVIAHQCGRHEVAVEWIRRAIELNPGNFAAYSNLGEAYGALGRQDEAIASYHRALKLKPDDGPTYYNLGNALRDNEQPDEAVSAFRRSVQLEPNDPEAHNNLGNVLRMRGEVDEAIAALQRALQIKPDYPQAHNNLGVALRDKGQLDDAIAAHRQAVQIKPDYPEADINLGIALAERGRLDESVAAYRRALRLKPDYAEAHNNLGNTLGQQGLLDEAIAAYRRAIEVKAGDAGAHSNLGYALHFHPNQDDRMIAEEQGRWNRQFADPRLKCAVPPANDGSPDRRLRIGYVSPDFREHVIGRNLVPLFKYHDRRDFEILCYSGVIRPDKMTEEFRHGAGQWRNTIGMPDEALAEMIRRDGVDILVDLTQHLAGNRLPVFARKPAPVQVSFAGYPESTGVEAIEYRISDRYLEAGAGDDGVGSTERVFLLESFWCYDPCGMEVALNELPAKGSGWVTFGSLNSFCKVNEAVLRLWARVLGRVKDSRLLLLSHEGSHRRRTQDFFEREGVAAHRVDFVAPCPRRAYLELYQVVDVVLDPFPYNGHTTSLDALWMGVPVVSLAGKTRVSRGGLSILSNLGLSELVAVTEEEYVEIATRLANDLPRLAAWRATLRPRMEASVLMDAPRFARQIEAAYRARWRQWCAGRPS